MVGSGVGGRGVGGRGGGLGGSIAVIVVFS